MSAILEINLSHLTHNYNYLRSKTVKNVKFLAVIKALAYGSDAIQIAKHLEALGVDYFGVAYAEEGVELRKKGITTPILVFHAQPDNYSDIIENNLEPNLYSLRTIKMFDGLCKELGIENYPVHIKYNSGLNRLGVAKEDIPSIHTIIDKGRLQITSVFSHLAASEDLEERAFTLAQVENFQVFLTQFLQPIINTPIIHQCNTSGTLNYPEAHFSMVRAGIGLYGYVNDSNLKPIASLTAKISQIQILKPGESLGYNREFKATTAIKSAVITIGHADGIGRIYGNGKGYVIINNQKAIIMGMVCMDMLMVDVSNIKCKEGDTVIIFNHKYTAEALAEAVGTISYELITAIGSRVKRVIAKK